MILFVGGIFLWKYSGAQEVTEFRSKQIADKSLQYSGDSTITLDQYTQLKSDLLTYPNTEYVLNVKNINPVNNTVDVHYFFLSTTTYPHLQSGKIDGSISIGNSMLPLLYFLFVIVFGFRILFGDSIKKKL